MKRCFYTALGKILVLCPGMNRALYYAISIYFLSHNYYIEVAVRGEKMIQKTKEQKNQFSKFVFPLNKKYFTVIPPFL